MASYYRRFCHEFAHKAAVLYQLTEKNVKWQWTQDHPKAFDELKEVFTNPPTLAFPDFNRSFSIHCDASNFTVGVILAQVQYNEEQVIAYCSKAPSATQRNWDPNDREWWAIVWRLQHFRPYLAGSRFTIYTDHKPLVGLKNIDPGHDSTGRRDGWAVQLSTYEFTIARKPGKFHGKADGVSRIPNERDGEENPNCLKDQTNIGLAHGKDPEIDVIIMQ